MMSDSTGWRPDPTARHEGRYFVTGRPTNRVRDGKATSSDPAGGQMLPGYLELRADGIRSAWLGTTGAAAIIVMAAAVVWILMTSDRRTPPPPETRYLAALDDAGLKQEFNSDANAIAHGQQVCRQLEAGEPQQGVLTDKLAVESFCPDFSEGFRVLEKTTVSGTFVLIDDASVAGITTDGTECRGANGYVDVNPDTLVTVRNGTGATLTTATLGPGQAGPGTCTFTFRVPVTEGEERYIFTVGRRGEVSYTFEQLVSTGIQMRLGQ